MSSNKTWLTIWSRSQRGMGLVPALYEPHQIITMKLPSSKYLRFRFSTWYEEQEVTIQDVYCICGEERLPVMFSSKNEVTILPQSTIVSDEVSISREIEACTLMFTIQATHPVSSGIQLIKDQHVHAKHDLVYLFQSVDVITSKYKQTVSVIGDSISEQATWANPVAQWLSSYGIGFLQHGISGNRLCRALSNVTLEKPQIEMLQELTKTKKDRLVHEYHNIPLSHQCFGKAGKHRLQKEILNCDVGTICMIFALGTNDLYQPGTFCASMEELVGVEEFMTTYRQLFHMAKEAGILCIALCIPSFKGSDSWTKEKEQLRCLINESLQKESELDGVVCFDSVLCNEQGELYSEYHIGDHLHPNEAGGQVIAKQIQKELRQCIFGD